MFAPHLGLRVMEEGCERALANCGTTDAAAALREALRDADPFVRY